MRIVIAISVWAFAIAGAIGAASWLQLTQANSVLLVIAIGILSFWGAFLPVLRWLNLKS